MNAKDRIVTVDNDQMLQELANGLGLTPATVEQHVAVLQREGGLWPSRTH